MYINVRLLLSIDNSPLPNEEQASGSSRPQLSSGDNSVSGGEMPPARYIASPHHQHHQPQKPAVSTDAVHNSLNVLGTPLVDSPDQGMYLS